MKAVTFKIDEQTITKLHSIARQKASEKDEPVSAADLVRQMIDEYIAKHERKKKTQKPITTIDAPQRYTAAQAAAYRREQLAHDDYDLSTASDDIVNYFAERSNHEA